MNQWICATKGFFCMEGFASGAGLEGKDAKGMGVFIGSLDLLFQPLRL
jgi:hypothetical protein